MTSVPEIFRKMDYGLIEEDYNPAKIWLKNKQFGPFINGDWVKNEETVQNIINPCTGDILASIQPSTKQDIENAISSCISQHLKWKTEDRATIISSTMYKIASLLERDSHLFAQIEALNRGCQVKHPREFDIPAMIKYFTYYGNCAQMASYEVPTELLPLSPIVVCITTCDTPLLALAMLLAPAFAAHSCICLMVPTEVAMSAMFLARICSEASGSANILTVLPGNQMTMDQVVTHDDVSKVLYFGPTSIARHLRQKVAGRGIELTALMSGKTPMLVFDSADLCTAVDTAIQSAWFNQGAVSWAVRIVLVQESIFSEFVGKLKNRLKTVRVGNAFDKLADVGRPRNRNVVDLVAKVVAKACENGIEVFQAPLPENVSTKDVFQLTLLIGGPAECNRLIDDEDSVPVITVIPFRTPKEAVDLANNSRYGLAASVWSESVALSMSVADKLQVGTVWINDHGVMDPAVPFGGWKESGLGSFGGYTDLREDFSKRVTVFKDESGDLVGPSPVTADGAVIPAYKLFYGGSYKNAEGNKTSLCCLDSKPFASIAEASSKDVRNTVEAAIPAQARWAAAGVASRAKTLYNMATSMISKRNELLSHLTHLQTRTKPAETFTEVVKTMKLWASKCAITESSNIEPNLPNTSVRVSREPLGIIAVGWNCGGLEFLNPLLSAVCYGNAVVLALDTPFPVPELELLKAFVGAAPPGVISVLTGKIDTLLGCLAKHQDVDAVWIRGCKISTVKGVEISSSQDMKYLCYNDRLMGQVTGGPKVTKNKSIWITKGEGVC